jgi:hypothetical protein
MITNAKLNDSGSGSPLAAGVYRLNSDASLAVDIYLLLSTSSADGSPEEPEESEGPEEWTFIIDGALSTAALTKMYFVDANNVITDSATADQRVIWTVTAAISLGAGSEMIGAMTSTTAAITLGASATTGDLIAGAGIDLGANATSGDLTADAAIGLGAGTSTGALDSGAAITVGASATVDGDIVAVGAISTGAGAVCTGDMASTGGAVNLGADSVVDGDVTAAGAITAGAGAQCGPPCGQIGPHFVVLTGPCGVSEDSTCVMSPNYPDNYSINEKCTIQAPVGATLEVKSFDVETWHWRIWDYVTVNGRLYSGQKCLGCGPRCCPLEGGPNGVVISHELMYWYSNGSRTKSGWKICI